MVNEDTLEILKVHRLHRCEKIDWFPAHRITPSVVKQQKIV